MRGRKILFYALWLLGLTVLVPTLIQKIRVFGVSPDVFLIFVIIAASVCGKETGAVCGFVFGLVFDFEVGQMIGLSALLYMYSGFLTGWLKERFLSGESAVGTAVATFSVSFLCGLIYAFVFSMSYGGSGFLNGVCRMVLFKSLYTTAFGLLLYVPVSESFGWLMNV